MRIVYITGALALLLSVAVIGGGIALVRQSARLAAYQRRHQADARAIEQLRAAARQGAARVEAPPAPRPESRPAPPAVMPGASDHGEIARRDAALEQRNRELADARASIGNLQAQLQSAGQEKQQAMAAAAELQKRVQELSTQLDSLRQQLDSGRAELQAAREHAAALEADNARMKKEAGAGSTRAAATSRDLAALQDIVRRRDAYLNSVLRRYREIIDQFRAAGPAPFDGIALTRIQNAISQAEDDMRRVNELDTQARQIETRLPKN